jgi:hypothetical protein
MAACNVSTKDSDPLFWAIKVKLVFGMKSKFRKKSINHSCVKKLREKHRKYKL